MITYSKYYRSFNLTWLSKCLYRWMKNSMLHQPVLSFIVRPNMWSWCLAMGDYWCRSSLNRKFNPVIEEFCWGISPPKLKSTYSTSNKVYSIRKWVNKRYLIYDNFQRKNLFILNIVSLSFIDSLKSEETRSNFSRLKQKTSSRQQSVQSPMTGGSEQLISC